MGAREPVRDQRVVKRWDDGFDLANRSSARCRPAKDEAVPHLGAGVPSGSGQEVFVR